MMNRYLPDEDVTETGIYTDANGNFELEKIVNEEKRNVQEKIRIKRSRKMLERNIKGLEENESEKLKEIINGYSEHILNIIETNRNIEELQKEVILIKEFIDKI